MNNEDWINIFISKVNESKDYKITDVRDREKLLDELRPKGKWVVENSETGALGIKYNWSRCNQCCWHDSLVIPRNFCPNCGADMRGGTK